MKTVTHVLSIALVILLVASAFPSVAGAQTAGASADAPLLTFAADPSHSRVGFRVRHLGISNVHGDFRNYDARVRFDPDDLRTLHVEATVDVGSIDTENGRRDDHLRSDDFFSAEQFPTMTFVSKGVRNVDGNAFELVGDLTIRDVTKEVVLEGEFMGVGTARGRMKAGFTAETSISRFDYGLQWDRLTEAGGLVVGEDVTVILEMELDEVTEPRPGVTR